MTFVFSGTMLRFVDYDKEVEIAGQDLQSALDGLLVKKPALSNVLLDGTTQLRRTHQVFLNGESLDPAYYSDETLRRALPVSDHDTVYFLTAIAGG